MKHQHDRRFIVLGYVETNTDIFETTLLHKSAFRSHSEAKGGWTRSEMHLGRTNQPITLPNLVPAYLPEGFNTRKKSRVNLRIFQDVQ